MNTYNKLTAMFAVLLVGLAITNEFQIAGMRGIMEGNGAGMVHDAAREQAAVSQETIADIASQVIPRGIPTVKATDGDVIVYGRELGITFDAAAQGIAVLAQYEQDTRTDKLTGTALDRYRTIGSMAACEYCCGATTMVFPDGSKSCGCAHSAAMRGVAAYLLEKHGNRLTDEQILTEVNRFKATYFPRQTVEKIIASSKGGRVDPAVLNQLSPQVGGC